MAEHDQGSRRPAYITKDELQREPVVPHPAPLSSGHGAGQWVAAVVFFVSFLCTIPFWPAGSENAPPGESVTAADKVAAYNAVKARVTPQLRAPATAEFASVTEARYIEITPDRLSVHGHVDAENAFGGNVRSRFSATAERTGDAWRVAELEMQ